ncbi:MAG: hypothetical protein GVY13_00285 [Alphaproteobacteria bacterium]|jgi:hypothetical protein|nr:hypothetical protein [Alphaproteobacteria bacterium]
MTLTIDGNAAGRPGAEPGRPVPLALVIAGGWIGMVALLLAFVGPRVLDGVLWDADDYMRIVQALDWLDGAGWYDVTQERLNPPEGVAMHWSRLPDLPVAGLVAVAEPVFGRDMAVTLAAIAVPVLLLLVLLGLLAWAGRLLLGRNEAELAPLMAMLSIGLMTQFVPGRLDHHGWQLVLGGAALACLVHALARPGGRYLELAAVATALGLWVGGESLPWLVALSAVLWLRWIGLGNAVLSEGLRFSAALCGATVVLLVLARPPGEWFAVYCDGFSLVSLGLSLTVLGYWLGVYGLRRWGETPVRRLAIGLIPAAIAAPALVVLFPECRGGPFSAVDPRLAALWMANVGEAAPLFSERGVSHGVAALLLVAPVTALAWAAWRARQAWRCRGAEAWVWVAFAVYLALAVLLMFWQTRVHFFAHLFAVLPLAVLLKEGWRWCDRFGQSALRLGGKAGWLLLLSPLPGLFLSLQVNAAPAGGEGDPAQAAGEETLPAYEQTRCLLDGLAASLEPLRPAPGTPLTIAGFVDLGSEILLRTGPAGDTVLAAPYHRNTTGILDTMDLFRASDPADARTIAARRGVDVLVLCPRLKEFALYEREQGLAERLVNGTVPDWLHAVVPPDDSGLLMFRVVLSGESGQAGRAL